MYSTSKLGSSIFLKAGKYGMASVLWTSSVSNKVYDHFFIGTVSTCLAMFALGRLVILKFYGPSLNLAELKA